MKSLNPDCTACPLHRSAKTVAMCGDGPTDPDDVQVVIIGEAPGAQEDRQGVPFVGESGKILRHELERNGLAENTYITNLVKCRPPGNRTPTAKEIKACRPYLDEELERLRPEYVVTAGAPATKTLFRGKTKITQFHGEVIQNPKVPYLGMPIYHPAFTLRDPSKLPGLRDDLGRLARLIRGDVRDASVDWRVVRRGNLEQFIREFEEAEAFGYDCETSGLFPFDPAGYISAVGIALEHRTWVIPGFMHPDYQQFSHSPFAHGDALKQLMQLLFSIARRDKKRTYAQNGKFDNKWMRTQFGDSFRLSFDIMLAHHLLDENVAHGLESLCRTYLDNEPDYDIPLEEKQGKSKKPIRNYQYCAKDATYTFRLGQLFEGMLREQPNLHRLFWKLTMPGARVMESAEMEGLPINAARRKELGLTYLSRKIGKRQELNDELGYEINWDSPQQIGKALYDDLGLPCKIFTPKKQPSTSEEALYHLKGKHPVADKLLEYREAAKLYNTYIKGWEQYRVGDRYHFDYKIHGTVTGRYSSPLHPIPRGEMRSMIDAPDGWTFVAVDLATAEMRIAAHLSKDPEMMGVFQRGEDIHWRTLMEVLSVGTQGEFAKLVRPTAEKLTVCKKGQMSYSDALEVLKFAGAKACIEVEPKWYEARTQAKAVNFGFIYGMHAPKFIQHAKKEYDWEPSMSEAKSIRETYFTLYSRLEEWHRKTKKLARLNGHVRCLTGRLRRLPSIQSKDRVVRSEAERQAVNSPVQGLIGDFKAMVLIEFHQTFSRDDLRVLGEHHDAVLTMVRDEAIDRCVPKMLKIAEHPKLLDTFKIRLDVPMEGEAELGPWGAGKKYELERAAA